MAYRMTKGKKKPPEGWEQIEGVMLDFESHMKEAVNEEHEGKRKCELTWKVHRTHWEKNRFIYDLMYERKTITRELFDWLVRTKIADGALIAKWRKPGYELLCSLLAIQKGNHNFGTTSHCRVVFYRVPLRLRGAQQKITPDVQTGCISCATGDGKYGAPIWWNSALGDDDTTEEENRATWSQPSVAPGPSTGPSKKRAAPEEPDELDPEVQDRLKALKA